MSDTSTITFVDPDPTSMRAIKEILEEWYIQCLQNTEKQCAITIRLEIREKEEDDETV
jgi:hypothetical protein